MSNEFPCRDCVFSRGEDRFGWCLSKDVYIDLDQTEMDCHREDAKYRKSALYLLGYTEGRADGISECQRKLRGLV